MYLYIKSFLPFRYRENLTYGNGQGWPDACMICRGLLMSLIALAFSLSMTSGTMASGPSYTADYKDLDARWLPWIGSWRIVSNTVNTSESDLTEEYILTVSPGDDNNSVTIKTCLDQTVISEEKITADGVRRSLPDEGCTGWYLYSWSETGKRLLLNSESSCQDNPLRLISGISFIDNKGEWLNIRLLKSGEEKAVTISRYRNVDSYQATPGSINAADPVFSRISAGTALSISEIIELSSRIEPEVLEAAIIELRKPFPINSKQLTLLADAEVPSQIVDIMVALSFPEKFTVEQISTSTAPKPAPPMPYRDFGPPYPYWPYGHHLYSWYWDSYIYSPYSYWYMGWNTWPEWYYPYRIYPHYWGGTYERDTGRLVGGTGYTRINPVDAGSSSRYARPRSAPMEQGTADRSGPGSIYGTSSSGYSSGSFSSSSSGSSSGSSSKTPCASPGGYSSGDCDY